MMTKERSITEQTSMPENLRDECRVLPDFCSMRMVFVLVLLGEILAILLALTGEGGMGERLDRLALDSLFIQWVMLGSAAGLCALRRVLERIPEAWAMALAWGWTLLVTLAVSGAALWLSPDPEGDFGLRPLHFLLRNLLFAGIISALALRHLYVRHHWRRRVESEARAHLQALQARIRPHFLFNCMNTIASLIPIRPQEAEQAVEDLSALFRASLADLDRRITLRQELDLCRQYLRIEALRLGPRLRMEWDTDDLPDDLLLPPLTLQPLLENAVYHGIEPLPEGGVIELSGRTTPEGVEIRIRNPLPAAGDPRHEGNRLALENVRERLAACFGPRAGVSAEQTADGGFRVVVTLPHGGEDDR
ncbi:MAG: sensor histidine kinase [Gammaproteobacteria bacterium]|nr:MAG: sensor histidine kinase [Gammaproteobacteria bacterium]